MSASTASKVSSGNALKAASVGANNVKGPDPDNVPSKEQASILGKDFIKKSLETTNVYIAREKRDKILKELDYLTPSNQDISYNPDNIDGFIVNNEKSHQSSLNIHNNSVPIEKNDKNTIDEYKKDDRYTIFSLKVPKFPDKDDLIVKIDNIIPVTIAILTLFIAFIV